MKLASDEPSLYLKVNRCLLQRYRSHLEGRMAKVINFK